MLLIYYQMKATKQLYKNVKQNSKKNIEGYVDIRFLEKLEDKELMDEQRIENLKDIITSLQSQGYHLGEICILVRQNKYGTAIAEAFNDLDQPIPVVSQESLLIASDEKVHLLTQFLNLIEHYHEDVCVNFMLLWFEYVNFDKTLCHQVLSEAKNLNSIAFFAYLKNLNIDFDPQVYENLSLYDKAEYVLRALNLDQKANAYIQFYLDEIFDFSKSKSKSMAGFLEYWEDQKHKKSISTSDTLEAVKIMTIHKSKGLQFPVVIYAHANFTLADLSKTEDWISLDQDRFEVPYIYERISKSVKNLSPSFEEAYHRNYSKQELANLNTAYVCMTRAVEQLYIITEPIRGKSLDFNEMLCSFLKQEKKFQDDKMHYGFGEKLQKNKKEMTTTTDFDYAEFESYASQDFYKELTAEISQDLKTSEAIVFGQNIHDILKDIQYVDDIENTDVPEDIYTILNDIVKHPDLSEYFKKPWKIYNETEIVFNTEIFRPDRICILNNDAVIIDYKTGAESSTHLEQLTNYKNAVEGLGFKVKKSILVYIRKAIYIKTL